MLRGVVKIFLISSSSFARKTTGRNRARSHSGAWRALKTKWDLKLSLPSATDLIRYLFIWVGTTTLKLKLDTFQLWRPGAWISSHFRIQVRSADECVAPGRRQPWETRWTSEGRLSSPETNLKVGLLPLFFMQLSSFTYVSVIYGANFPFKAGPPWFEFLVILTFLHHGIEQIERHLLWNFHKKVKGKVRQMCHRSCLLA